MAYGYLALADGTVTAATRQDGQSRDEQLRAVIAIHGDVGTYVGTDSGLDDARYREAERTESPAGRLTSNAGSGA
jgi:hypothetical protein